MRKNTDQNYSEYLHFLGSDIYAEDHEDSKKLKVEKRMPNRLQIIHEQSLLKYESYVLSCPLVLWCSCTLRALVPYTPRVICTLLPHVPHVLRALVLHVSCALCGLVACAFRALFFFAPYCLGTHTLRTHTLRTLCSIFTSCALDFSCISLIFFCLFATCDFLVEFTKVKANIVCHQHFEVGIIIYQQYDIFENIYI